MNNHQSTMATQLIHMKCQNCGANLDLDLDHLIAFCPYCGEKLLIDIEKLSEVLIAKEETKRKELEFNRDIETKRIDYDKELESKRIDLENEKRSDKLAFFLIGTIFLIWLICKFIIYR